MSEDPAEIDIVVASYDRTLTWKKLQIGFEAMWYHRRAKLICTNADHFCPFPGGEVSWMRGRSSPPWKTPRR